MNEFNISFSQQIRTDNPAKTPTNPEAQTSTPEVSIFQIGEDKPLTKEEKKAQKKKEKEAAKAERKRIANTPDGIIQGGRQGSNAGDCWLLAQMNSLSKTDWGKKALSEAITTEESGDYTVHLKGVNKDIRITKQEFESAKRNSNYSSGDADAILYELAVERHFQDTNLNNGTIRGNDLAGEDSLQYLLTGLQGRQTNQEQEMEIVLKAMAENPDNNNNFSATYIYHDNNPDNVGDIDHAMSVQQVILDYKGEIDKIIVLDSYHPDKPQTINYKTFKNNIKLFGYTTTPKEQNT